MERLGDRNQSTKSDVVKTARLRGEINKFIGEHTSLTLMEKDFNLLLKMYIDWRQATNNGNTGFHKNGTALFRKCTTPHQKYSRDILLYVMERLFWTKVNDSDYVATILSFVLETEGSFLSIFEPPGEKCPSITEANRHLWTEYFLHHVYAKKMMVQDGRLLTSMMIDHGSVIRVPMEMAVSHLNPELLRTVLRYGAIAGERKDHSLWQAEMAFIFAVCDIFNLNPKLLSSENLNLDPDEMSKYNKLLLCCNLILNEVTPRLSTLIRIKLLEVSTCDNLTEILVSVTLPSLKKCLTEPLSLKRACRLSVRKTLNINWLLPHGIYKLPLPESLQDYLDVL